MVICAENRVSVPGRWGIGGCRMLRADSATSGMLIIMLTARVQEHDVEGVARGRRRPREEAVQPARTGVAHPVLAKPDQRLNANKCLSR